jgi:AcrR family transcriptional regulator
VPRTARHHAATRDRLVGLARDLLATRGRRSVQLADVARAAGVTTPALYRYFRDRRELELAVLARQVAEERADTDAADDPTRPGPDRLRAWFARQADYLDRTPRGDQAMLLAAILDAGVDAELATVVAPALERTTDFFARALDDANGDDDVALLAALAAGVTFLHASGHLPRTPEQVYRRALTVLGQPRARSAPSR